MALRDYVAEFMDTPSEGIGVFMVHLRRAEERIPIILALEAAIQTPLEIVDAVEGKDIIAAGHPTICGIDEGVIRSAGEVGCMASHIAIMVEALKRGLTHAIIFEDDCSPCHLNPLPAIQEYLRDAKRFVQQFQMEGVKELLLLGTCGCYSWRHLTTGVKSTQHFNGSHAYIISAKFMRATIAFYIGVLREGKTAPIDGVLPILLKREGLWSICPENDTAFFRQNREIASYTASDGTERRQG